MIYNWQNNKNIDPRRLIFFHRFISLRVALPFLEIHETKFLRFINEEGNHFPFSTLHRKRIASDKS